VRVCTTSLCPLRTALPNKSLVGGVSDADFAQNHNMLCHGERESGSGEPSHRLLGKAHYGTFYSMSNIAADEMLLAIDSGGTKTVAWLVECSEPGHPVEVVGRGKSKGANPLSVGFDAATRAVSEAIAQARTESGSPDARIDRAILSIAGAANADVRDALIKWAHAARIAQQVAIVSDFLPVLAAGTSDCVGVALVSGTGSSAFARNADGRTARCGGWGYLLGDEGSGYALGRAALRLTLHALETGKGQGALGRTILAALGAQSVSEVTHAVYGSSDVRAKVASIAPFVIAAADIADPRSLSILDSAARDLAELVARAARSLDLAAGSLQVAVSGGVLVNSQPLRERLQTELRELAPDCSIRVIDEPLHGCVRLAAAEHAGALVQWH
jgi:N-acetylglucosamine kinase-like BadF-type ATPase